MPALEIATEKPALMQDADGVFRVGGTRVRSDTVIGAYQNGATPEQIADKYPALTVPDIYGAIAYCLRHREEVEGYLTERRLQIEGAEREIEARFPSHGARERLLARWGATA